MNPTIWLLVVVAVFAIFLLVTVHEIRAVGRRRLRHTSRAERMSRVMSNGHKTGVEPGHK